MLSTLTIVSIFTEIFIAGILVAGAVTFFRKYSETEKRKEALFAFLLIFFSVRIILTIASQMAFNLGRPLSELIAINRFISISTIGIVLLIWFFLLVKFKVKRIRWIKWATALLAIVSLAAVFRILISQMNLVYREDVIEPLVSFSAPVPLKTLWVLMWLVLTGAYFWRACLSKGGRRQLFFIGGGSSLLIVIAHVVALIYSNTGQSPYLLISWLITLLAVTGLLLSEVIPPESKISRTPLSFLRTRILFKLVLIIVLLIVILFEATTLVTIAVSKHSLSSIIIGNHQEAAVEVRDKINQYVNDSLSSLRFIAGTPAIKSGRPAQIRNAFRMFLEVNPRFDALLILDKKNQVLVQSSKKRGARLGKTDLSPVFSELRAEKRYLGRLTQDRAGAFYFPVAVPLATSGNRVLVGRLNIKEIEDFVSDFSLKGKRVVYLVGSDGRLFVHPDTIRAKTREDYSNYFVVQNLKEKKEGKGEFYGELNQRMVGAYVLVPDLGWGIVVEEPMAEAYFPLRTLETNSLLFIITGMVITCLVGIFFARSIEKPIKDVISGTEAIRKGDLSFRIPLETQDEIGELASAFNQMTSELRESQDRLILSEKLASLGTMAAGMAHEIKNPLVSLRTFTQLLPQKWQDPEYREKFAAIVPQEIERINKIAESLLKFGRPIKPELTKVDVNTILEEVILLFESECKKNNIRITTKFADLPPIVGDASQLSQAFVNIALNAIQVMPKGGEITFKSDVGEVIKLKHSYAPSSFKKIGEVGEMSWGETETAQGGVGEPVPAVFIEISDTGEGIPEENLKSLFDPFFTTKISGTGMGLPITLRIIEEHKGSIKVRSQAKKGTTFLVTLPQNLEQLK